MKISQMFKASEKTIIHQLLMKAKKSELIDLSEKKKMKSKKKKILKN